MPARPCLARWAGLLAVPEVRDRTTAIIFDATDLHAVDTDVGMQDKADGAVREARERRDGSKAELSDVLAGLPSDANVAINSQSYGNGHAALAHAVPALRAFAKEVDKEVVVRLPKRIGNLEKQLQKLNAEARDGIKGERKRNAIDICQKKLKRGRDYAEDVRVLVADAENLPAMHGAGLTVRDVKTPLESARRLLDEGFRLSQTPPSQVLAVIIASPLERDEEQMEDAFAMAQVMGGAEAVVSG